MAIFRGKWPLGPIWVGAGGRTPTAQYGELAQAKRQACALVTDGEFPYLNISVGRVLDASPHLPPPNSLPPPPAVVCPLGPARSGYNASQLHVKLERRSRALWNANGYLPTRPDGRARPVWPPGRFSPFSADFGPQSPYGAVRGDGHRRRNSANWPKPSRKGVHGCRKRRSHITKCPFDPLYTHSLKRRGVQGV